VITKFDLGLTAIGRFDSADSAISNNDRIKNLGRHREAGLQVGFIGRVLVVRLGVLYMDPDMSSFVTEY
jgi:hypothetical protein